MLDHFGAVFFVKMRQSFSVRGAAKGVPARLRVGAQLTVIVDFAVEDNRDAAVFVEGRLMARW